MESYLACTEEDIQHARADELEAIGLYHEASDVRKCTTVQHYPGYPVTSACNRRLCPRCAEQRAKENAWKVARKVRKMTNPKTYIISLRSRGLHDLPPTVNNLNRNFKSFRLEPRFVECIESGVRILEVKLARSGRAWVPHLHAVLGVLSGASLQWLNSAWYELTEGYGSIVPFRMPEVRIEGLEGLSKYLSKRRDNCPIPGEYSLRQLWQLHQGLKGKRIFSEWGKLWKAEDDYEGLPVPGPRAIAYKRMLASMTPAQKYELWCSHNEVYR